METRRIAFVGGGNMASALIGGVLENGWPATGIRVLEPDAAVRESLRRRHRVAASEDPSLALKDAQLVVWAVKPQVMQEAARQSAGFCRDALHLSVAAGVKLVDVSSWLSSLRVVRAMPNTPALVGEGVTGLYGSAHVSDEDRRFVETVVSGVGRCFWVADDAAMDAVTALSGSGPAYVFHFLEALQEAAQALGFDEGRARDLATEVVSGATLQAARSGESFGRLRERVTSKGGTTEAALRVLEAFDTRGALLAAVIAARHRAAELGEELARPSSH
ncbi:MAG TPA: pyrroline-5-carboxylate reductase [Ramlibacter sp.]|nr:pyrroline-5-carboxylate reductase [Ramlibacter sp.]